MQQKLTQHCKSTILQFKKKKGTYSRLPWRLSDEESTCQCRKHGNFSLQRLLLCRAWALGRVDFKSWGTRVQELQLIGSRDHVLQLLKPARPRVHAL